MKALQFIAYIYMILAVCALACALVAITYYYLYPLLLWFTNHVNVIG